MVRKGSGGFTLIELLVVIVIIMLLAALLLPAIIKALCMAKQGAAEAMVDNLTTANENYEKDYACYPPGVGSESAQLATFLSKQGPKKMKYFEFVQGMQDAGKNIINPVWPMGGTPEGIIIYRNNIAGGGMPGSATGPVPLQMKQNSFDIWCADCGYTGAAPLTTAFGVNNWE
jgi:prepilin-type N-terminal cleavage/methylation domain-containing protein